MGAPMFKFKDVFRQHDIKAFSANFELYGDISDRIISLLTTITPRIEVYSVDESFLDLSQLDITDYVEWGRVVRETIYRNIGVPVSIGIAPSKTLAKLASEHAKKSAILEARERMLNLEQSEPATLDPRSATEGVVSFINVPQDIINTALEATPLKDIWGVGWRLTPKLQAEGLHTALDLKYFPSPRASKLMGVHGRQMVAELNGICCKPLERLHKLQQSIMRGRQFGEDTGEFYVMEAAVTSLTARAAATLRRENQLARSAAVVIRTNRHKPGYRQVTKGVRFATPTADTGAISRQLITALETVHNSRERYHKADVYLYDFVPADSLQLDLGSSPVRLETDAFSNGVNPDTADRSKNRMAVIDEINGKLGKGHIRFAAENLSQSWRPRYRLGSPRYTSDWAELPEINTCPK